MMHIEVMSGPLDGHCWDIDADTARIGPSVDAEVVIPHDRDLPGPGVVLRRGTTDFELIDGTSVRSIEQRELFRIGHTWIRASFR